MEETATNTASGERTLRLVNLTRNNPLVIFAFDSANSREERLALPQVERAKAVNKATFSSRGQKALVTIQTGVHLRVPIWRAVPVEGLLGLAEEVRGLPQPTPGVRYVVDVDVHYALHRLGRHRSDLLMPGPPRYDHVLGKVVGFDGLNWVDWTAISGGEP
ncbi:MAG: hypothetical protein JRM86_02970 [Nitrososphaerota archaeon]|nr:hypothetical protein [Nitrososphaerota archaeon]